MSAIVVLLSKCASDDECEVSERGGRNEYGSEDWMMVKE